MSTSQKDYHRKQSEIPIEHVRDETWRPALPIYTVDLSCRASDFDYTPLFERLRGAHAISFMDARWFLDVKEPLDQVTATLLCLVASGDKLFVTELGPETRWSGTGLRDEVKTWLRARMTQVAAPREPGVS